ncbi:MAG: phosphatase PAP2 family protein [Chlamydiae bacterium]|nr:phosphatase PAP2 family protein [Chlamydiota bacterium]
MPWKIKNLCIAHLCVALLVTSLFLHPFRTWWEPLDQGFFRIVNGWISTTPFWQHFWAMANHRLTDFIIEDVGFLLLFTWILIKTPRALRIRKAAECIFVLLFGIFIILFANELFFRQIVHIQRKSPTLVMDSFTKLSDSITWLKIKTESLKSFPGDHATTTLLSMVGFFYLTKGQRKIFFVAFLFGVFLSLPRLVVGAHWLTDVLIGSGSIVITLFSWAFYTPLANRVIRSLESGLGKLFTSKARSFS